VKVQPQRVLDFIRRYYQSNHETPTMAEIGRQFDLRSSASVHQILTKLEEEGSITRVPNVSRGVRVSRETS